MEQMLSSLAHPQGATNRFGGRDRNPTVGTGPAEES